MYSIAVWMPYINPSFARSGHLEGSSNFATSCVQSPTPSPVSSPSEELGTSSDRTDGEETPGMRLDVASLPEDTDPEPASCLDQSKARSRSAAGSAAPAGAAGRGAVPAAGWPARLSAAVRWLSAPGSPGEEPARRLPPSRLSWPGWDWRGTGARYEQSRLPVDFQGERPPVCGR